MQAGEDDALTADWIADTVRWIKRETALAVTLSLGERQDHEFRVWRAAGADRYLLRFETSDPKLFRVIHPGRNGEGVQCEAGSQRSAPGKELLSSGRRVIVSLAPSFVEQFSGARPSQIIHALKQLGFFAVSETARGAQQVSANVLALMRNEPQRIWISSACPTVVDFIARYHPECQPSISPLLSPLLTHCKMLRAYYGDDAAIVFIGPCIAKKKEAADHPELLDAVLTFEDLDCWMIEENIHLADVTDDPMDRFAPEEAREGALYAIEGGIIAGVAASREISSSQIMSFSGVANVEQALKGVSEWKPGPGHGRYTDPGRGLASSRRRVRSRRDAVERRRATREYASRQRHCAIRRGHADQRSPSRPQHPCRASAPPQYSQADPGDP